MPRIKRETQKQMKARQAASSEKDEDDIETIAKEVEAASVKVEQGRLARAVTKEMFREAGKLEKSETRQKLEEGRSKVREKLSQARAQRSAQITQRQAVLRPWKPTDLKAFGVDTQALPAANASGQNVAIFPAVCLGQNVAIFPAAGP